MSVKYIKGCAECCFYCVVPDAPEGVPECCAGPDDLETLEEFCNQGKIVPAASLPEGWNWYDYYDGSGSLQFNDKEFFIYNIQAFGDTIEYKREPHASWSFFNGKLKGFKIFAERLIRMTKL